ncbi:MAG TPA: hypothetical protein VGS07_00850 [Thermoanaerobaculia bacterium]|jgi:hypothetical protein|nr:hypothetical protein [Thermoanaerobaculia bacterium]
MTHDEYEQRKRRLEEELRAGVALLETAFRHQIRALQLVWAASGSDVEIPSLVMALPEASRLLPTEPAPPAPPLAPPPPTRRGAWDLLYDVQTALPKVPEVFDRGDICRAIGYEPDRGSLYRTFQNLIEEGAIAIEQRGTGRQPSRYKKTGANTTPTAA